MTPSRRFIAPQARAGNGHGYLTQPQRPYPEHSDPDELAREQERVATHTKHCDEPEAIGDAIVNAQTELARTYDRIRYTADIEHAHQIREQLSMEQRMADARRRAKLRHADISGEMHAITKMLEHAERGGRKTPPAAVTRLQRIEARLDYRWDLEHPEAA